MDRFSFFEDCRVMPAVVMIGAQWGDEGKGKLVDMFSSEADMVVRYQGGANAGHTLKVDNEEIVVHLVPSAVFHPKVKSLIAPGVALDLSALCEEIQSLQKAGHLKESGQLLISDSCTLLLDAHKQLDQAREEQAGRDRIGTTGKGIGPAYESRAARRALLFADLFDEDSVLLEKLEKQLKEIQFLLSGLYKKDTASPQRTLEQLKSYRDLLKNYRCRDMSFMIDQALKRGQKVLFEGAQGSLLDLYHGNYPYVTSSSTLSGGALTSAGLGTQHFAKTILISKAYTTRVGAGPFPTECIEDSFGRYLQEKGREFGATTGRKRRCGWLDLPALKYAIRLNGASSLALMKLDVLSGMEEIKICTAYKIGSKTVQKFPTLLRDFKEIQPIYKSFKAWDQNLSTVHFHKELPQEAREYIDFINKELALPVDVISVGPSRSQTICLNKLFG